MDKLSANITLQQWIEQRLVEVLGIDVLDAHQLVDECRLELGKIATNFSWSQPAARASRMAKTFAWELALQKVAEWFELCPKDLIDSYRGEL